MNTSIKRTEAHQAAVLERRRSNASNWDRRPKGQRTRADSKRKAMEDR